MYFKIPKYLIALTLVAIFSSSVKAQMQDVTATSGGNIEGTNYSVSFTIGESVISTLPGINTLLTQGFHQPRLFVTEIKTIDELSFIIKAYPNPVTNFLNLETSEHLPKGVTYRLYSMNGSKIDEKDVEGSITQISFQSLISATYFLNVVQDSKTLKTFKIIKK